MIFRPRIMVEGSLLILPAFDFRFEFSRLGTLPVVYLFSQADSDSILTIPCLVWKLVVQLSVCPAWASGLDWPKTLDGPASSH